jgi:nitrogenase molybdenum-iron protein alpha/beta subunit
MADKNQIIKIPGEFNYEEELRNTLAKDAWLRHLFNKIGKQVVVYLDGELQVEGKLVSIHYAKGAINLEVDSGNIFYLNWRHVRCVEVKEVD